MPFAGCGASFDLVRPESLVFATWRNYEGVARDSPCAAAGCTVAILEFTNRGWVRGESIAGIFSNVLAARWSVLSGDRAVNSYLPVRLSRFSGRLSWRVMSAVGFASPEYRVWTLGTLALHLALGLRGRLSSVLG